MMNNHGELIQFKYSVKKLLLRILAKIIVSACFYLITILTFRWQEYKLDLAEKNLTYENKIDFIEIEDGDWSFSFMLSENHDPLCFDLKKPGWFSAIQNIIMLSMLLSLGSVIIELNYLIRRKRVFLSLSALHLQHNEVQFRKIIYTREFFYAWKEIMEIHLEKNRFTGNSIELILFEKSTHSIPIIHCEQEPEYILKVMQEIKQGMISS